MVGRENRGPNIPLYHSTQQTTQSLVVGSVQPIRIMIPMDQNSRLRVVLDANPVAQGAINRRTIATLVIDRISAIAQILAVRRSSEARLQGRDERRVEGVVHVKRAHGGREPRVIHHDVEPRRVADERRQVAHVVHAGPIVGRLVHEDAIDGDALALPVGPRLDVGLHVGQGARAPRRVHVADEVDVVQVPQGLTSRDPVRRGGAGARPVAHVDDDGGGEGRRAGKRRLDRGPVGAVGAGGVVQR